MTKIKSLKNCSKIIILFSALAFLLLLSCKPSMGNKSSSGGEKSSNIGNYYTSYFVNDSTMLYFIKPMKFTATNSFISSDFTFNKIHNKTQNVTMNFSVITPNKISINSIKKIKFNNKEIEGYKILFNESNNKKSEIRFSSSLITEDFTKLDENAYFEITTIDLQSVNKPTKKTSKVLKDIKNLISD